MQRKVTVSESIQRTSHAAGISVRDRMNDSTSSSESDSGLANDSAGAYGGKIHNSFSHGYSVKSGYGASK